MHITVVLHPWQSGVDERARLVSEAAAMAPASQREVLAFTGDAHPAALADRLAQRLTDRAGQQLVLLPTGTESEAIAAMLARQLGGVTLGRCSALSVQGDTVVARRPAFGGRAELELRSEARVTCATLRPQEAPGEVAQSGERVDAEEIALQEPWPFAVQALPSGEGRPRVEGAAIVVSGGRGIGDPEGFDWLARIAKALGAGLGGSLPAVDAGWIPVAHQVGQSGKFVTPKLYFAVGISGTPQHLAGIAPGARIVALNNDRAAAIFGRCDVAVEGDWREILPLLAQQLEGSASAG